MKEQEITRESFDQVRRYADVLSRYAEVRLDLLYEHMPHVFAKNQEADCQLCQKPPTPPNYCEMCGHELP